MSAERCEVCGRVALIEFHPLPVCCATCGSTVPHMDRDPTGSAFNWSAHRRDVARYVCPDVFHGEGSGSA